MFSCAACGKPLREGDGFCPGCGTPADSTTSLDTSASQGSDPGSPWAEVIQRLRRATLGEFEIGRELGRGAMAAVFLAHEISLDRKVAIKVMSPGLLMDEGMAERFRREAITIANLNHPNIVSVHSVRQAEGLHFAGTPTRYSICAAVGLSCTLPPSPVVGSASSKSTGAARARRGVR